MAILTPASVLAEIIGVGKAEVSRSNDGLRVLIERDGLVRACSASTMPSSRLTLTNNELPSAKALVASMRIWPVPRCRV